MAVSGTSRRRSGLDWFRECLLAACHGFFPEVMLSFRCVHAVLPKVIARCKIKLITTATSWPPKVGTRYPDKPLLLDDYHYGPSGWVLGNQKGQSFGPYQVLCGAFNSQTMLNTQLKRPEVSKMRDYLKQIRFQTPIVPRFRITSSDFLCDLLGLYWVGAFKGPFVHGVFLF